MRSACDSGPSTSAEIRRVPLRHARDRHARRLRGVLRFEAPAEAEELAAAPIHEITPAELARKLGRGDDVDLINVREPHEYSIARIDGARLVPLGTLTDALSTLRPEREIVVHCKSGGRSARAVRFLQDEGFRNVWNLTGGITRWSAEIDPTIPTY